MLVEISRVSLCVIRLKGPIKRLVWPHSLRDVGLQCVLGRGALICGAAFHTQQLPGHTDSPSLSQIYQLFLRLLMLKRRHSLMEHRPARPPDTIAAHKYPQPL